MPKEIIIVDDCSTDNSRRIIEKLTKENETIKAHISENKWWSFKGKKFRTTERML